MTGTAELLIADSLSSAALPDNLKVGVDVVHIVRERFGIDDARALKEVAAHRPLLSEAFSIVIAAQDITLEAQNALLKVLEETRSDKIFYLIVPRESLVIPTLRSRFVKAERSTGEVHRAEEFIRLSYTERLDWIANQAKNAPLELSSLVTKLGQLDSHRLTAEAKRSLLLISQYVYNRGASRKMLLEELALALPERI